jgi:DNA polymerase III delta prime subunit
MSKEKYLWVDRYRPAALDGYVWSDGTQKKHVLNWIKEKHIPNLLISGSPGTGKSTIAKILLNELGVHSSDVRIVNGSHTNGVDDIRELGRFAETMPSGDYRYVLLDEADYLTPNAQAALRNMIEEYTAICRWILTCNYEHKIIPALKSRTQGFHIENLDKELFLSRIANILIAENIELTEENLEILDEYATVTYPDLRKCINLLQQNCIDNTLTRPSTGSSNSSSEYMVTAVNHFKNNRILEARKLICANIRPEEYEEMYKLLYRNLNWWGNDDTQQNQAIVIIANRLRDHAICADPEICLCACLVELSMI